MSLLIRDARPEDCGLVLELIRELAEFEKLSHEVVSTEALLRETIFGSRKVAEVLIAEWQGKPAGFALFFHNFSTFLGRPGIYLEDLFVRPVLRGNGIGENLLRRLGALALERGCGRLEWSVLDWNENAIRFYRRLGAEPLSEWTMYRVTGEALKNLARVTSS